MTDHQQLFDRLEGFYAYECDATDSGVHDPIQRTTSIAELKALNPWESLEGRCALSVWIRESYLSDEAIKSGYGWEDALGFLTWINNG